MKQMTLVAALKDYFGYQSGKTAGDFLQEIKALSAEDKQEFRRLLPTVGYEIIDRV